ncbi:secreted RxLR effector protein 161-like [Silene latifolia]|uniref:secreted RxLR effector protein 161-like n=1 Tax=Silene latifolia TaxID=37657 RepID=UPI003D776649
MVKCNPNDVPIQKEDKFSLSMCPKTELERNAMKNFPYASLVGSLMYAQVCTRPGISFAVVMLGRYQSNPGMGHYSAAKKVLRYLKGTRDKMLTYRHTDQLEVIGYADSDFGGCVDSRKSTFGYVFALVGAISGRVLNRQLLPHPLWKLNL